MKAIIPVAGAGTKLRPHTYTQPKALIPLAGKSVLSIIVDQLAEAGIQEFIFIIGYLGDKIQDYVKEHYPHLTCHFVLQNERQGLGHAIYLTKDIVGSDEVFIALGDTICEYDVKEVVYSSESMLGVKKVDDPRNFGVAEMGEHGSISKVVEKPQIPKSNMALVGLYKIKDTPFLFSCLEKMIHDAEKTRNEYNLTDALECMILSGVQFKSFKVQNWFDCGRIDTLLDSNAILMKKLGGKISPEHVFENVIIVPPVSIAKGCEISNSIIGPNVAIGEDAKITYSIVRDSIIGSFANLYDVVLHDSLIGSDTEIKGETRSLNIGDNTQIDLG
ncbi:MAG: NTP transferase domain-containing protein [Terrimonas sp.]|uniref:sugar phosphate nucleotidyltransferase n=1 Tax=Terrimonas sp. TaxID=1914338 RepID=UPI000927A073|nr:sugar phosphate nucleotidyltransferase [Terrimonas sp.]MBN8787607.1 NTP transferase domain-containing protein [Terrimonas sp.]OJY83599.1 MAG: glucose-1-phosphate thymidylyltransferase [Sphingobacteriales bacterium 40-81]PVD50629.1 glucose-1-phosphate thymidylyltransferase [Terrimonas sp.]